MPRHLPSRLLFWFFLAAGLVVLVAIVSLVSLENQRHSADWATHSLEVETALSEIRANVARSVAQQQSFLLHGDAEALRRYQANWQDLRESLTAAQRLVVDNPRQVERFDRLGALLASRRAELDRVVAARQQGGLPAAAAVDNAGEAETRQQLSALFSELSGEEKRLFKQRTAVSGRQRAVTLLVVAGGSIFIGLFLLFVASVVRREMARTESAVRDRELAVAATERHEILQKHVLGIVGHDLRNPLAAITGSAGMLAGPLEITLDRRRQVATRLLSSARRMNDIIDILLDFSQMRVGQLQLLPKPCDLGVIVADIAAELRVAHASQIIEVETQGELTGVWDQRRLGQVVSNLLSNAIKYGDPNTPVRVAVRSEPSGNARAIEVHNGGAPIPAALLDGRLFEPFVTTPRAETIRKSFGLGLYIAWEIVDAHGGSIDVTSSAEQGTTFRVVLPREVSGRQSA